MPSPKKLTIEQRGLVLFLVMVTALLLIAFVGALGVLSKRNLNDVVNQVDSKRAKYAAYAGLSEALKELRDDNTWGGPIPETPLLTDPNATYEVQVWNHINGSTGYEGNGGAWVPKGAALLRSIGRVSGQVSGASGLVALAGYYRPNFDFALFALGQVSVSDSFVRPYRSDGNPAQPDTAHVASKSTAGPAINVNTSTVEGNLIVGVNGDPALASAISVSGSTLTGNKKAADDEVNVQRFRDPDPANPSSGFPPDRDLTLDGGGVVRLSPGSYGDITISNGAVLSLIPDTTGGAFRVRNLNISGANTRLRVPDDQDGNRPVIIYVEESVNIVGPGSGAPIQDRLVGTFSPGSDDDANTVDVPTAPRELQIYMLPGSTGISVTNGAIAHLVTAGTDSTAPSMTVNSMERLSLKISQ